MSAQPSQMVVGNMVRRVLKVIRDEEERTAGGPTGVGAMADAGEDEINFDLVQLSSQVVAPSLSGLHCCEG